MLSRHAMLCALAAALLLAAPIEVPAEPSGALTLSRALQRAAVANPKLAAAGRDIGCYSACKFGSDAILVQ